MRAIHSSKTNKSGMGNARFGGWRFEVSRKEGRAWFWLVA